MSPRSLYFTAGPVWGAISPTTILRGDVSVPIAQTRREGPRELHTLPRVTQTENGEAGVELRRVQPQSCAVFPHSTQSHLKTKPVQDTPLSVCSGDFLSPKLLQDPACLGFC